MTQGEDVFIVERLGEHGEIAVLRTNRPESENRTDYRVVERRAKVYAQLAKDNDLRVYIITGTGEWFDTGGELNAKDPEECRKYQESIAQFLKAKDELERRNIPKIAAINGLCVAGGMSSVLDADFAIAVDTARFGYPEILRSGFPIMAMETALDYIPQKKLLEACYFGELYPASWMQEMHLVNQVVSQEDFWPTVMKYAEKLVSMPKELIQRGRQAYFDMLSLTGKARTDCAKAALSDVLKIQGTFHKGDLSY